MTQQIQQSRSISTELRIPCKISRSGFSAERVFDIALPSGAIRGAAPREYFRDSNGEDLSDEEPPVGQVASGFVIAQQIGQPQETAVLYLPSGDVIRVPVEMVS
jgi:hypothetical protein